MMPKVSFVVPAYNAEKTLNKCLDSLAKQTMKNIEVIVINDGSKDRTAEITEEYVKAYPEMFKLINKENGGVSEARNKGIEEARGEYLGFVDSDDYVDDDFAELMYQKAKSSDADVVVCPVTYEGGDVVKKRYYSRTRFGKKVTEDPYILIRSNAYSVNKLVRRTYYLKHGFKYESHAYEDSGLLYNVLLPANRVECVNIPFYHYNTVREGSATNIVNETIFDIFLSMDSFTTFFREHGAFDTIYETVEYLCVRHIFARIELAHEAKAGDLGKRFADAAVDYLDNLFPKWRDSSFFADKSSARGADHEHDRRERRLNYIKTHRQFLKWYAAGFSFFTAKSGTGDSLADSYYSNNISHASAKKALEICGELAIKDMNLQLERKGIFAEGLQPIFTKEDDHISAVLPNGTDCDVVCQALERLGYKLMERTTAKGHVVKETYRCYKLVIEFNYSDAGARSEDNKEQETKTVKYYYTKLARKNRELPKQILFIDIEGMRLSEDVVFSYADEGYDPAILIDHEDRKKIYERHPRATCYLYDKMGVDSLVELKERMHGEDDIAVYTSNLTKEALAMVESVSGLITEDIGK